MGLFDFVGDIGRKLFSKAEDASEAVTKHIAEDNPGVDNVSVTVENGVANIQGVAASATALEKAILMAGNIAGITSVNADSVTIQSGENLAGDDEFYVIQKGDTLWAIAEKTYGNGAKYTAIVEANKEVIKDAESALSFFNFLAPFGLAQRSFSFYSLKNKRLYVFIWHFLDERDLYSYNSAVYFLFNFVVGAYCRVQYQFEDKEE